MLLNDGTGIEYILKLFIFLMTMLLMQYVLDKCFILFGHERENPISKYLFVYALFKKSDGINLETVDTIFLSSKIRSSHMLSVGGYILIRRVK